MLRSTGNFPVFEENRNEMDIRPLRHWNIRTRAKYYLEEWKERRFDQRYAAMVAQKREPLFSVSKDWTRRLWW